MVDYQDVDWIAVGAAHDDALDRGSGIRHSFQYPHPSGPMLWHSCGRAVKRPRDRRSSHAASPADWRFSTSDACQRPNGP